MAKASTERFLEALTGEGSASPNPSPMYPNPPGLLPFEPHSPGLRERIWWGAGSRNSGAWAAQLGMNLQQSATVEDDGSGAPLHVQQRRQIDSYRKTWRQAGHLREPRVSVFRTVNVLGGLGSLFESEGFGGDYVTTIDRTRLVFGRSYAANPDTLVMQLGQDTAIEAADTLMLTIDNELGVDHSIRLIRSVLADIAPALGWR
jgi:alkanesulfonate monooxygenase SsuD/methylene tetrahydromethanopterin reductase-like flavin-dependent oxidoreductase (luciferase family)